MPSAKGKLPTTTSGIMAFEPVQKNSLAGEKSGNTAAGGQQTRKTEALIPP